MAEAKKVAQDKAEKEKNYVKPYWLPWTILAAELAIVILIGLKVCQAAMA